MLIESTSTAGGPVAVKVIWGSGGPVDVTEVEALAELLPDEGILTRRPRSNGHGTSAAPRDGPVNVDERLANIHYEGPGDSAVHLTELHVTASLLRSGMSVEAAVLTVLEEVQKSLGGDPRAAAWDWAAERLAVEKKCYPFIQKHPELSPALPDELRDTFERKLAAGWEPRIIYAPHIGWHIRSKQGVSDRARPSAKAKASVETEQPAEARKYRFKLVSFADLRPGPEPLYLVDELVPVAGLVDVWGKAKCYKSFWTLDLMLHVAMGWEYRDRCVHQGAVVYCAFEGAHGYKKRVEALRRHYCIEEGTVVPLYVMPGQANLIAEHRVLIADIAEQLGDTKPAAVVLDTLNKSLVGSENKDVDMGAYVRAAEAIRDRFGCVVIIVHHCGYDETRPRGHSSLPGAVDAQLAVTRAESVITVTVEMMRDGPEDTQVVSAVEVVEVGSDQNGKTLTSLVVVPSDADAGTLSGWPRGLQVFHRALKAALASEGVDFQPDPGVLPVRAVGLAAIRTRFYRTYVDAEEDEKKRSAKVRQAFGRALKEAQKDNLIAVRHLDSGQTMFWVPERI